MTVTKEMLEAGISAALSCPWLKLDIDPEGLRQSGFVERIYLAMKALDPEVERLRGTLEQIKTRVRVLPDHEDANVRLSTYAWALAGIGIAADKALHQPQSNAGCNPLHSGWPNDECPDCALSQNASEAEEERWVGKKGRAHDPWTCRHGFERGANCPVCSQTQSQAQEQPK